MMQMWLIFGPKAILIWDGFWTDIIGFINWDRSNLASSLTGLSCTLTLRSEQQTYPMLSTHDSKWHWSPPQLSLHIIAIWTAIRDFQKEASAGICRSRTKQIDQLLLTVLCLMRSVFMETWGLCCCVYICAEPAVTTKLTLNNKI